MRQLTIEKFKEYVLSLKTQKKELLETLGSLHFAAQDIPVVIVTCGPSLSRIPKQQLIDLNSKCILIAIKQAHDYVDGSELFHVINPYNLKKYEYTETNYILSTFASYTKPVYSPVDLFIPYEEIDPAEKLKKRLAATLDFDKYLLSHSLERPWGPGIMMELAIYFAIHLGTKDIFLVSYDLHDPSFSGVNHYTKFYTSNNQSESWKEALMKKMIKVMSKLPQMTSNRARFMLGSTYNPASAIPTDEYDLLISSSEHLYRWLNSLGINLGVCSDNSFVSRCIPRFTIEELSKFLDSKMLSSASLNSKL